jgi:hypothetical protein
MAYHSRTKLQQLACARCNGFKKKQKAKSKMNARCKLNAFHSELKERKRKRKRTGGERERLEKLHVVGTQRPLQGRVCTPADTRLFESASLHITFTTIALQFAFCIFPLVLDDLHLLSINITIEDQAIHREP